MKYGVILLSVLCIITISCNKECRSYNEKSMSIVIMNNGENVSEQFAGEEIYVWGYLTSTFGSSRFDALQYDGLKYNFNGKIDEFCPDDSLSYLVEFYPIGSPANDTFPVLDTLDFMVSSNGGGKKCNDCTIDEIISRNGNVIEIGDEEIMMYLEL